MRFHKSLHHERRLGRENLVKGRAFVPQVTVPNNKAIPDPSHTAQDGPAVRSIHA